MQTVEKASNTAPGLTLQRSRKKDLRGSLSHPFRRGDPDQALLNQQLSCGKMFQCVWRHIFFLPCCEGHHVSTFISSLEEKRTVLCPLGLKAKLLLYGTNTTGQKDW